MREIQVSTAVFSAIWANRHNGEESENDILLRLLTGITSVSQTATSSNTEESSEKEIDGVYDRRNNVHFQEGTRVFRNYKGLKYSAIAQSGLWMRVDTQRKYTTLNQLNASITEGPENIWNGNWRFIENGTARSIDLMRKRARSV